MMISVIFLMIFSFFDGIFRGVKGVSFWGVKGVKKLSLPSVAEELRQMS